MLRASILQIDDCIPKPLLLTYTTVPVLPSFGLTHPKYTHTPQTERELHFNMAICVPSVWSDVTDLLLPLMLEYVVQLMAFWEGCGYLRWSLAGGSQGRLTSYSSPDILFTFCFRFWMTYHLQDSVPVNYAFSACFHGPFHLELSQQ